jgi:acyl-coenzyme A thioesterase PaaI-like protein
MSVATALWSVLLFTSRMTTVEYKVNLLKPVTDGVITARAR